MNVFFFKKCPSREIFEMVEGFYLGKNLNMSKVTSIGYCIEVVGKERQGVVELIIMFIVASVVMLTFSNMQG